MTRRKVVYRILLIDDDIEMLETLQNLLAGHRLQTEDFDVLLNVDRLDVVLSKDATDDRWQISPTTLKAAYALSRSPHYDLVMTDYSLATQEAKEILWHRRNAHQSGSDPAEGLLLTVRTFSTAYQEWLREFDREDLASPNIFTAPQRVILRSFVHRSDLDHLGPLVPTRSNATQAAFPNAEICPLDTRQEFFANDRFYSFYEQPNGREFYRHLVGTYYLKVIDGEILRHLTRLAGKIHVRKSVLNIAMFAALVAIVGGTTQYLEEAGTRLLEGKDRVGWWFLASGLVVLIGGAIMLALSFERLTLTVIRWVGRENEKDDA
jgi:CheY-like chemotaxis protein